MQVRINRPQRRTFALVGWLRSLICIAAVAVPLSNMAPHVNAQGILLNGIGPVNRSMAGASTAAPIDAMGALHWNPASISAMSDPQLSVGLEMLLPTASVTSSITTPISLAGSDSGEPGVSVIPSIGWVHGIEDTPWTVGLGVYGIGGFRTNYPGSALTGTHNPVLLAPPFGFGGILAEAEFMQIVPTLAVQLTDRLSFGVAPTLTLGSVSMDPLTVAAPLAGIYPSGTHGRWSFGGGVQAGLFYKATSHINLGASIKSTQWMEDFRFFAKDTTGTHRVEKTNLDLPMILSVGASFTGIQNTLISTDVRYVDYTNAAGFGDAATFNGVGALQGLGWQSVMSASLGVQRQLNNMATLRFGYTYQENPIAPVDTLANLGSPLIIEHIGSVGTSIALTEKVNFDLTYIHGFENSSTGPMTTAGSQVTSEISADALSFGLTVKY